MENTEYDYLNSLCEEDKEYLLEKQRERELLNIKRHNQIMEEIADKKRSQGIIGVAIAAYAIIAICGGAIAKSIIDGDDTLPTETITISESDIVVERLYITQIGDTLTDLHRMSGMSIDDIKLLNNLSSDRIRYNQRLTLKYIIKSENIDYCTESISVDNRNLYEIAGLYDTTVASLYNLNKEAIERVVTDNKVDYIILSDTILVPNYISPKDLQNIKK